MAALGNALLSQEAIIQMVGHEAFARAMVYAKSGHVYDVNVDSDALTVTGRVSVDEPKDGKQNVVLAWKVRTPSGRDLGTVRQSNQVSAGSLAGGWADSAQIVAEAAAYGLFDLVRKLR